MAQGLASGVALLSFGAVSHAVGLGLGTARRALRRMKDFSRGAFIDTDKSRWDSLSRRAVSAWSDSKYRVSADRASMHSDMSRAHDCSWLSHCQSVAHGWTAGEWLRHTSSSR